MLLTCRTQALIVSFTHNLARAAIVADLLGAGAQMVLAERTHRGGWTDAVEGADVINAAAAIQARRWVSEAFVDIMLAGVPFKPRLALADDECVGGNASSPIGTGFCWAEVHELTVFSWKGTKLKKIDNRSQLL